MAESNGSIMNGNGSHVNGKANGKVVGRRRVGKPRRSFIAWTLGALARLSTWAAILTVIFRCPPTLDACNEATPYICGPYFQVKNAVTPHLQPYYDSYAAPYVEIARPYYETANNKIWTPASTYVVQYGAPWAEKAQGFALTQWAKNGQPQVTKYQSLAQAKYDATVAPHVSQARKTLDPYYDIARTNALQAYYQYLLPGYDFVRPYAAQGYDAALVFTTTTAMPTAYWAWDKTYAFVDSKIWPHVRAVYIENVEPQLQRIGERLSRYRTRQKVKSAQESVSVEHETDAAPSSFIKPAPQSTTTQSTTSQKPAPTASSEPEPETVAEPDYVNPVQAPPPAENESEKRKKAREMVTHDLEMWQTKFAAQADEGASDMEERVDEIAKRLIKQNANTTGKELLADLEKTIEEELAALRTKISSFVEIAKESSNGVEDQVISGVRAAGMAIKKKAQAIRDWRQTYDKELQETVISVADVHFQILDETRNLALQQIGMRWAWADGVTYKDWAKYHELKSTLTEWTEQLKQLIVSHPALIEAHDASARVEDEGMEIATVAAKELVRLKEVARWKITAGDASDNFDSEAMKLAAEAAQQEEVVQEELAQEPVVEKVDADYEAASEAPEVPQASEFVEAVISAAAGNQEPLIAEDEAIPSSILEDEMKLEDFISSVSEDTEQFASALSETLDNRPTEAAAPLSEPLDEQPAIEIDDEADNVAQDAASTIASVVEGVVSEGSAFADEGEQTLSSVAEEVSASASSAANLASSEISEVLSSATEVAEAEETTESEPLGSVDPEDPLDHEHAHPAIDEIIGEERGSEEDSEVGEIEEDWPTQRDETIASEQPPVKAAFLGAAAQEVPHRQPVLEDYVDVDAISTATGAAEAAYSSAVSRASEQYSSAVSVVSAQIYGTAKPVHEQLFASVSSAYDKALSAASGKFSEATQAAAGLKPTPATPTKPTVVDWERVESIASQKLNEGRLWADIQYQSALIALGLATPTPTSTTGKYYEQAKFQYYAGLGLAQERYSSFLAGASSALSSLTAVPTSTPTDIAGTASSLASAARESAASAAQAAGSAAGSVLSAAGGSIQSAAQAVDDTVSAVVEGANEKLGEAGLAFADSWNNAVAQISGQIYGEPTQIGWFENIFSDVSSYASAATEAVGDKVSSATDAAQASAVTASADASKQYASVSDLVSELISGKEPSFTESVLSRLQAAYATAAANIESLASEASEAAASAGEKVSSAASQATEAVKDKVQQHARDEL